MPKVEVFQSSRGYRGQDIWIWTQLMALWANLITNRRCLNSWVLLLLIKVQVLFVPSRPYHPAAFPLQPPAPTHSCFLPPSHEGRCWVAQRCLSLATGPLNVLVSEVFWATSLVFALLLIFQIPVVRVPGKSSLTFLEVSGSLFFISWLSPKKWYLESASPFTYDCLHSILNSWVIFVYHFMSPEPGVNTDLKTMFPSDGWVKGWSKERLCRAVVGMGWRCVQIACMKL